MHLFKAICELDNDSIELSVINQHHHHPLVMFFHHVSIKQANIFTRAWLGRFVRNCFHRKGDAIQQGNQQYRVLAVECLPSLPFQACNWHSNLHWTPFTSQHFHFMPFRARGVA